jgi:Tol biopolymer transport system component
VGRRQGHGVRLVATIIGLLALVPLGCAPVARSPALPLVVAAAPLVQGAGPPVTGRIVFVVAGDLWQWHDGEVRQLTVGERYEGPAWSPDGDQLAASLVGTNHSDVVLLNPDGDLQARLTDHRGRTRLQDSDWARLPAWSPDGTRIAYTADVRTHDLGLWSIGADGRSPRQLFIPPDTSGGVDRPTWSPEGNEIALATWRPGPSQIEVLTAASGRTRRVTSAANGAYDPAWSPTGQWIAHVVRDGTRHDIWLVHPDGTGSARLTSAGRNRMPVWSPTGEWLAFLSLSDHGFEVRVIAVPAEGSIEPGEGQPLITVRAIEGPAGLTWGS